MKKSSSPLVWILIATVLLVYFYNRILLFGFWKDDWINIWLVGVNSPLFLGHWFHPGTLAEFYVLGKLFGDHVLRWQMVGYFMRATAGYCVYLMVREKTGSVKAALFSGILSVFTVIGLDSVTWIAPRVVITGTILLCYGMYRWLRGDLVIALCIFFIAFIADPGRMLPIPVMLLLSIPIRRVLKWFVPVGVFLTILLGISTVWLWPMVNDTVAFQYVSSGGNILNKIYVIGNYFCSLFYLMFGSFIPLPEFLSTGVYNRLFARIGFIIPLLFLLLKRNKIYSWFICWILLFYLPDWMAEPRLTMGVTHRYMVIAGVGFIGIIGYWLSRIRTDLAVILFSSILVLNVTYSRGFLEEWSTFRDNGFLMNIWATVERDTSENPGPKVFYFTGVHPVIYDTINLSSTIPYAVRTGVRRVEDFSFLVDGPKMATEYLCKHPLEIRSINNLRFTIQPLTIYDIYAWEIHLSGAVSNISVDFRKKVAAEAIKMDCLPIHL